VIGTSEKSWDPNNAAGTGRVAAGRGGCSYSAASPPPLLASAALHGAVRADPSSAAALPNHRGQ